MKNNLVFYITDNILFTHRDTELLEENGFKVQHGTSTDEFVAAWDSPAEKPALIITGCQLPYGKPFSDEETCDGLETGVAIYKWTRKQDPHFPIILFTSDERVLDRFCRHDDPFFRIIDNKVRGANRLLLQEVVNLLNTGRLVDNQVIP